VKLKWCHLKASEAISVSLICDLFPTTTFYVIIMDGQTAITITAFEITAIKLKSKWLDKI
jgi:hypothetical protein